SASPADAPPAEARLARLRLRHLHHGLRTRAHLRRILPRAGPADRLSLRRLAHHGDGALYPDGDHRLLGRDSCAPGGGPRPRLNALPDLREKLVRLIEASGPLSVADYMATCLYDPESGYYTTREPFGVSGDFTTAPEISQMFGELVAVWLFSTWHTLGAP